MDDADETQLHDELAVGATAALIGVSVRTLHHWDEIGLVRPSGRSHAGYRLYSRDDVARMHRVLVYRDVGIPLAQIARLLDDPRVDEHEHLRRQRRLLTDRIDHLRQMVDAVDSMLEVTMNGKQLTSAEMAEIFGTDWDPAYQEEAQQRWGDTPEWAQSQARTDAMSRQDWERVKADTDALEADLARAVRDGVEPGSATANALAERHRASIGQFYDCSYAQQVCLGRMVTTDARWTDRYEALQPGLAGWLSAAIDANAATHGVDPGTARWE